MKKKLLQAKIKDLIIDVLYVSSKTLLKSVQFDSTEPKNSIKKEVFIDVILCEVEVDNVTREDLENIIVELYSARYINLTIDTIGFTEKGYEQHINISTFESSYNESVKETKNRKDLKINKYLTILALALPVLYILFEQYIIKIF